MNIATKRFAPLIGVLTLLVLVALAGSALSSVKKALAIGPASATIELPETAPNPMPTATSTTPTKDDAASVPDDPAQPEPTPEVQQQQAPQVQPQAPIAPAPAAPAPEVIIPQQQLIYDDDLGDFDFDD